MSENSLDIRTALTILGNVLDETSNFVQHKFN